MSAPVRECRWCRKRQVVELVTDGRGRVLERPLRCGCEERRSKELCIGCSTPVPGKAWRCEACQLEASREYSRRYRENNPEAVKQTRGRTDKRRRTEDGRARRRAYEREYRSRPEVRARRNEQRRRRNLEDAGFKKAERARRYRERHPERVKEQQARANARRAAEKREYMHRYGTKYVGEGIAPTCRKCDGEVPWDGKGRPRLDCFLCRPLDSRERQIPRVRGLAKQQKPRDDEQRRSA